MIYAHAPGMLFTMKQDEALDPVNIGFLGLVGIPTIVEVGSQLVHEAPGILGQCVSDVVHTVFQNTVYITSIG